MDHRFFSTKFLALYCSSGLGVENKVYWKAHGSPQRELYLLGALLCQERWCVAVEHDTPKLVHHRCGYPFLTRVIGRFNYSPALVVEYRDGRPGVNSIPLYHCPRCHQELQLWWDGPDKQEGGDVDEELREDETPLALS